MNDEPRNEQQPTTSRDHRMPWRLSLASAVVKALCGNPSYLRTVDAEQIARDAFRIADATLREFKKPRGREYPPRPRDPEPVTVTAGFEECPRHPEVLIQPGVIGCSKCAAEDQSKRVDQPESSHTEAEIDNARQSEDWRKHPPEEP